MRKSPVLLWLTVMFTSLWLQGEVATKQEMRIEQQAVKNWLSGARSQLLPFSFTYSAESSNEILRTWPRHDGTRKLDADRTEHTIRWADHQTGLEVRLVLDEYSDFPVVEWTVYFKNAGANDTPILEDIQALNLDFQTPGRKDFTLHYIAGDGEAPQAGYITEQKTLAPTSEARFAPVSGRPTNGAFPYYNLDWGDEGRIIVVGWSGQWASCFSRDGAGTLKVRAGQELTHLKLHPGEEIRSPMIVQQFWKGGDWIRAQNIWRRWMRAHNMPRPSGKNVPPILAAGTAGFNQPNYAIALDNESDQKLLIKRYSEEKLGLNYWWMDIYNSSTNFWMKDDKYGTYGSNGLYLARAWEADPKQYPNGLRAVSDYARSEGMGLIVWYEPEQVWPGYKIFNEHPEWLLSAPTDPAVRKAINQGIPLEDRRLLNLGNPEALQWLTDHLSQTIAREGIAVYRQDFNLEPLVFWRASDAPDRQGMTENLYVQGYLRYWDELRKRDPDLLIDTCASGGRRNDIETLRRAVPLWRSDDSFNPVMEQTHTYGLSQWVPYSGTGIIRTDTYAYRSALGSSLVAAWDLRDQKLDYDRLRKVTAEFQRVSSYYVEDFYPLTEFSLAPNVWLGWQFNRPEQGDGMVQAFRRADNNDPVKTFLLRDLDPQATYHVTNLDDSPRKRISGKDLMRQGLSLEIPDKNGAVVIVYSRVH